MLAHPREWNRSLKRQPDLPVLYVVLVRCACSCAMNWARCFKMSSSPRCFPGEGNQPKPPGVWP